MRTTNTIKSFFILGCVLVTMLIFVAYKMYTKPHRSVIEEEAIVINATDLFNEFEHDEIVANGKYLDQVLEVNGKVSDVSVNMDQKPVIMLETSDEMFGVRCTMEDSLLNIKHGATVTIKGICTGYLSDVVITNGILVK